MADCALDGLTIHLDSVSALTSEEMARVVGIQCPGDMDESGADYDWEFRMVPTADLVRANQWGEEPDGGWKASYLRHKASDDEAGGAYLGRQDWLKEWCRDSRIYPLFVEDHADGYRIIDGHHRLAGAFWNEAVEIAAFVGRLKPEILTDLVPEPT